MSFVNGAGPIEATQMFAKSAAGEWFIVGDEDAGVHGSGSDDLGAGTTKVTEKPAGLEVI